MEAEHLPSSLALDRAAHSVSSAVASMLGRHGLTLEQWRVLDELAVGGGMPTSEIAAAVLVPGPTFTRLVDKLASQALVYRTNDAQDRRRVFVHVSSRGRMLHEQLAPLVADAEAQALDALRPDEERQLRTLLHRIIDTRGNSRPPAEPLHAESLRRAPRR